MEKGIFIIITGMSGAGKTTALKILEDLDYFFVDNLPPELTDKIAQLSAVSGLKKVAVVLDDSKETFFQDIKNSLPEIGRFGYTPHILFLDAPNDMLVRRYSENYHKHPLAKQGRILDGIRMERERLKEIRGLADRVINTGDMTTAHLKNELTRFYFDLDKKLSPISITVMTFGYKFGIPLDADIVMDARILPNPFYDEKLRDMDGRRKEIQDFVFAGGEEEQFLKIIFETADFLIPKYIVRGKSHVTMAIGCTGGRHRSVASAERLAEYLRNRNYEIFLEHRDINK